MERVLLKIGEKASEKWMERFRKMGQGGVLEYDKHTGELYLFIILHNIKAKEKRQIKQGLIRFRLYEKDDCILPIVAVDNPREDLLLELPFDPSLYEEEINLASNKLNIFLIEKKDETIQMMRTLGLGEEFVIKLFGNWVWKEKGFTTEYQSFLKEAYQNQCFNLWEQATPVDWDK
ncbi:hypothetical protein [Bacillus cereus]|uniref:hypothetical protein n=1 Tax=Bacillus cereus TaxID=1396 RepID=UPI001F32E028|nr:hypothetical protein [Bacillus cereus]BCC44639.1 hypothetical protein BCJMU01_p216 [Bacillus cereus]